MRVFGLIPLNIIIIKIWNPFQKDKYGFLVLLTNKDSEEYILFKYVEKGAIVNSDGQNAYNQIHWDK